MRALCLTPQQTGSLRLAEDFPEPDESEGQVLVRGLAIGVCGTDREIISGEYGAPPPGATELVLGHESLGEVISDSTGRYSPGQLVAGIVRFPDPVPCVNCAAGEWDMCRNGMFTERGIKAVHGFGRERWRAEPDFLVPLNADLRDVGVLLEPTSVVAKAWEHIERIGARATWRPDTVLVTGAGPIGLLAAMLGRQRGLNVHVLDRVTEGRKPELVAEIGATYHATSVAEVPFEPDIIVECTGASTIVLEVMDKVGPDGIVCLTGVSSAGRRVTADAGALNRALVLENNAVFGSVNANRRHWALAAEALGRADQAWLGRLITRRVGVTDYADAFAAHPEDIKVLVDLQP
ncbi:MAG TPA: glucose 1-dehydrogenase [Micromonosporaceae bacterium]|nr:glucose 1-dehydrogenase [Micromonosporaceae bacterium]